MRWSLNEIVTESSRVQCEQLCRRITREDDDSVGCLSNHGFDAFSAKTVKRESTNHGINASDTSNDKVLSQPTPFQDTRQSLRVRSTSVFQNHRTRAQLLFT